MHKIYSKFSVIVAFMLPLISSIAQTTIYSEDFGIGTALPSGWNITSGDLYEVRDEVTDPPATGTTGSFLYAENTGTDYQEIVLSGQISTMSYTGIAVSYTATTGPDENSSHSGFTTEWSTDGVVWNSLGTPYEIDNYNEWKQQTTILLGPTAEDVVNLMFRFSFSATNDGAYFSIDDFIVTGTYSAPVFYNKSGSNISDVNNWGRNLDGTGVAPTNFTDNGQLFNLINGATVTLTSTLTISGLGSKLIVGDGVNTVNFTIPSGFSYLGVVDVSSTGTLTIANTTIPTLGVLSPSSTVVFNGGAGVNQSVPVATYHNLVINNTLTSTLSGPVSVQGELALTSGTLVVSSNTLTVNGSISRTTGFIRGSSSSNFIFNGSTAEIALTGLTAARTFNNFTLNSPGGSLRILSGALIVNGHLEISAGTFIPINANPSVTLATANGYVSCTGTGMIQGNATLPNTTLLFSTTNLTNASTLVFDSSTTSTRTVNITISGSHTINLASNVTVPTFNQSNASSTFNLGNRTIVFSSGVPVISGTFTSGINGTVNYAALTTQSVVAINYGNLIFSSTGQRNLPASGTIGIAGTFNPGTNSLSVSTSTINFNGTGTQVIPSLGTSSYYNLTISNNRNANNVVLSTLNPINISGTFNPSATFSSGGYITTGSSVVFTGGGAQTIPAFSYNNLTINGTRTTNSITLASGVISINGALSVSPSFTSGTFITSGNTLNLTGGTQAISISNISPFPINNLSIIGAGTKTLSGSLRINGVYDSGSDVDRIMVLGNNRFILDGTIVGTGLLRSNGSSKLRIGSVGNLGTIYFDQSIPNVSNTFQSLFLTGVSSGLTLGNSMQITDTVDISYTGSGTALSSNGNLTLLSSALKTAVLYESKLGTTSVLGNVIVQRYVRASTSTPTTGHYFGSPISNGNTSTIYNSGTSNILQYNESADRLSPTLTGGWRRAGNSVLMQVTRGYSRSWTGNATINYVGNLNNGDYLANCTNTPLQYTNPSDAGWNLLSNPYPSSINWQLVNTTNIQGDVAHLFNSQTGNYDVLTTSDPGYIETGRGFFVQAASGGGTVGFSNAMRVKDNNNNFSRIASDLRKEIKISLIDNVAENISVSDPVILSLDSSYTNGFDIHDARKFFGLGKYANMAFILDKKDSLVKQSINPETKDLILPLYLKIKKSGTYTLKVDKFNNINSNYLFYIKDNQSSFANMTQITDGSEYSFVYDISSSSPNRLSLVMTQNIVTNDNEEALDLSNWSFVSSEGGINIVNERWSGNITQLDIIDISGRNVYSEMNVQFLSEAYIKSHLVSGIYMVRFNAGEKMISGKVVVK